MNIKRGTLEARDAVAIYIDICAGSQATARICRRRARLILSAETSGFIRARRAIPRARWRRPPRTELLNFF